VTTLGRRSFLAGSLALAGAAALPATRSARAAAADLDFASALDAAWAIRAGRVSSVELTSRMLERIARHNPPLNAIVMLAADAARAGARAADEARARRESRGPFHGVPITIKDTFEVAASDAYLQTIETRRRVARGIWQAYFRTHDAFLMPTALVPAFPHDHSGNQLTRVLATRRPAPLRRPLLLDLVRHAGRPARDHRAGRPHRRRPPGGPPDRGALSRTRRRSRWPAGWPT
jgi:Asp-tRNA(Asn)/Glu-tRNA(Gln) amidotransferase A subunit family amidase